MLLNRALTAFALYTRPRMLTILALGFSSGLPRALCAWTLAIWLARINIDIKSISLFAAVSLPYNLKFLLAPLVDGLRLPILSKWLGHRRSWLLTTQIALFFAIIMLAISDPLSNIWLTAVVALLVAFFSASQDIVVDAYRVEIMPSEQQGMGAAVAVLGYRLGMIASGAGALFIAKSVDWIFAYQAMALLMIIGIIATICCATPPTESSYVYQKPKSLKQWINEYVIEPFTDFMKREYWFVIILFIVLYKLSDAFMGAMTGVFYVKIGFDEETIATIVKIYGVIASIIGSIIGGVIVVRLGIIRSLWWCGISHAITNLMFVAQARIGADAEFLALSITFENISGGMGTAAFVAFLSSLVNKHFTATQYALLSSLAATGTTWLAMPSGWFAEKLGWEGFFILSVLLAVPGLITLWWLNKRLSFRA